MILSCNSCGKKFVVPDSAITASGRMVQCGSCGNKWKQFPENIENKAKINPTTPKKKPITQKSRKSKKIKKITIKKPREISLYSPEYLAKKHGIKINSPKPKKITKQNNKDKISFGFYNSLIVFIFIAITLSRILYFSQNFIINKFPITEFYLNYFFESIRNIFEILRDLLIIY